MEPTSINSTHHDTTQKDIRYGSAGHYTGDKGADYFAWQDAVANAGAHLTAAIFEPFISQSDTVLDFGCGNGAVIQRLECGHRIGVEINPAARASVIAKGIECHEDLDAVANDAVDVVISNHALEHVPNPLLAVSELRSKVKPSGQLILCLPLDDWRAQKRFDSTDRNHHLYTWTPLLLGNLLDEAGWRIRPEDIRILTRSWPPYYGRLSRTLPEPLFDLLCRGWAVFRKRRQLLAIATAT